ncbi:MAG: hypothetical protein COW03_08750 [Cytophagales bacterium CG12_big_fil_rev_8_21_14_0_65_40_12]|nr:MAG: hypothetical protein COW03_08750 [Cytophagales bacterium CG12_big_fil_rev_8_21_14_0_65_40_12]PIW05505.1 MAG: hypothetical protein COW40_04440 [Cytophagales bacterium CG17_big_fil_post_rev_8_21_14_2_50_40_13]
MKLSNVQKAMSALAFIGFTALVAFLVDRYNTPPTMNENTALDKEHQAILNRAMKDANYNFIEIEEDVQDLVKVYDKSDYLIGEYTLEEFRKVQATAGMPRANYLSDLNNLYIYKVLE